MTEKPVKRTSVKATKLEKENRIKAIVNAMIKGKNERQIWRLQEEFSVSSRQFRRYLAEAFDNLRETSKRELAVEQGKALERLEDLYYQLYKERNWKEAAVIVDKITALLGFKSININLNVPQQLGTIPNSKASMAMGMEYYKALQKENIVDGIED